jgi:hypothetical protein
MTIAQLRKKIVDCGNIAALARLAQVPYKTAHDVASGKTENPTMKTVERLSKALAQIGK